MRNRTQASTKRKKIPPAAKPTAAGIQARLPYELSAYSIDGANKDQKEAAIITPAAKPSMVSSKRRLTVLKKNTTADPTIVQNHVNKPPSKACRTTD